METSTERTVLPLARCVEALLGHRRCTRKLCERPRAPIAALLSDPSTGRQFGVALRFLVAHLAADELGGVRRGPEVVTLMSAPGAPHEGAAAGAVDVDGPPVAPYRRAAPSDPIATRGAAAEVAV